MLNITPHLSSVVVRVKAHIFYNVYICAAGLFEAHTASCANSCLMTKVQFCNVQVTSVLGCLKVH